MSLNKKQLAAAKVYLILDAQVLSYSALLNALKDSVRGGIDIVQLRDKNGSAKDILAFCRHVLKVTRGKIPFIVNDRVDVAVLADADGVHVGQGDVACLDARRLLGHRKMIGVSCQTMTHVLKAQQQGADYIGFGSVFPTLTKPNRGPMRLSLLRKVIGAAKIPVFPIGGIHRQNIGLLRASGIGKVAVCRDILLAPDPCQAVKEIKQFLSER